LTQLTFTYTNGISSGMVNSGTSFWGRFIPGTDLIYYSAHNGGGWYKSFTSKDDGSDQYVAISGGTYAFGIGLSPTGNKLISGHATYWNNPITYYTHNVDGSGKTLLKNMGVRSGALVLVDGYTVIVSYPGGDIHAINMDGTNYRVVIDDEHLNYWSNYHPVDGQAFLMTSNRTDGNNHIYKINADGTGIVQLTDGDFNDAYPHYSPDAQYIMYRRLPNDFDTSGGAPYPYELVIKKVGSDIEVLTDGNIYNHRWVDNGNKIAYIKCPDDQIWGCELWIAEKSPYGADLFNKHMILDDVYTIEDTRDDWLLITLRAEEGTPASYYGRGGMWKVKSDGTGLTQLTFTFTNGISSGAGNVGTVNWGNFVPGTDLIYYRAHGGGGWWKSFTSKDDGSDQYVAISGSTYSFSIGLSPTGNKLISGTA
ncbi:hypothetical protein LCGC14_2748990, partial [marine sediment metagenome]